MYVCLINVPEALEWLRDHFKRDHFIRDHFICFYYLMINPPISSYTELSTAGNDENYETCAIFCQLLTTDKPEFAHRRV